MSQLAWTLDDPIAGNYRGTDPVSSVAGAVAVDANSQRRQILAVLQHAGRPMYVAEIAAKTGIPSAQVASRLPVMSRAGLVVMCGMGVNHRDYPVQLWRSL